MDFQPYLLSETEFQKSFTLHVRSRWPHLLHVHIANERKTAVKVSRKGKFYTPEGNKLKAMGVLAGIPDNLIFNLNLAIELKVKNNYPSPDQYAMMEKLETCGWNCFYTRSLDEALKIIETYIEGKSIKSKKFKPVWEQS